MTGTEAAYVVAVTLMMVTMVELMVWACSVRNSARNENSHPEA